jgi:hypothetical protein
MRHHGAASGASAESAISPTLRFLPRSENSVLSAARLMMRRYFLHEIREIRAIGRQTIVISNILGSAHIANHYGNGDNDDSRDGNARRDAERR